MTRSTLIKFALAFGVMVPAVAAMSQAPAEAAIRIQIGAPVVVVHAAPVVHVETYEERCAREAAERRAAYAHERAVERRVAYEHAAARDFRHHDVRVVREVRYVPGPAPVVVEEARHHRGW